MNHPKAIVHLDRLARNYKILSNSVNGKRIMAVVKANAYGHGAIECSKKLEDKGIILRGMQSYKIKNALRLTIGNNSENKLFLKSINRIFKNV